MVKTRDAVEQAGFAGSVGTDHRGDQPRLDGHVDVGKRVEPTKRQGHVGNG